MNTPLSVLPVVEYCARHDYVLLGLSDVYIPFEGWRHNRFLTQQGDLTQMLSHCINRWADKYPGVSLRYSFTYLLPDGTSDFRDFDQDELMVYGGTQPITRTESTPNTTLTGMPVNWDYDASRLLAYGRSPFHPGQS